MVVEQCSTTSGRVTLFKPRPNSCQRGLLGTNFLPYNFKEIPTVTDVDAWWVEKRSSSNRKSSSDDDGTHDVHLPQPSYWPFVSAIGLLVGAYGLMYSIPAAVIGAAITTIAVYSWSFEPVNEPSENSTH